MPQIDQRIHAEAKSLLKEGVSIGDLMRGIAGYVGWLDTIIRVRRKEGKTDEEISAEIISRE